MRVREAMFKLLADFVVLIHLLFILFVLFGGFLVLWRRRFIWLHLPALVWGILIELSGWICPLTPLEIFLREQGGVSAYDTTFIGHYLLPLIYPAALTREIQYLLAGSVLLINGAVYWFVASRSPLFSANLKKWRA